MGSYQTGVAVTNYSSENVVCNTVIPVRVSDRCWIYGVITA